MLQKNLTGKRTFYERIFKLVLPIIIQNLLSSAVSSADVIMLNYVGQSAISAVSLASQYANILFMVFYGLGTGATILCAQYYGKGNLEAIQMVEGIALRFSLAISVVFCGIALLMPDMLMRLFTNDAELIAVGASYLRFMSVSYLCCGIAEVYLAILRSVEQVVISTALNILAFSLNIILNAVFIFGLFGAPRLGAAGVGLATSVSRLVELIACFAVSRTKSTIKLNLRYMFVGNRLLFKDFVRLSLPALGNDIVWSVAFAMYSVVMGHMGTDAVAANSFVVVVRNFGTILCFGNKIEEARDGAKKLMKLTVISGAVGGLIVIAAMPVVLNYASSSLSAQAMHYLKYMLWINTYYIMGAAVNTTLIAGAFRAGGDSRFGFICDTIVMWCYGVPLGFWLHLS